MTANALASTVFALALALAGAACSSGPSLARVVTVENGKATRVLLTQVQSGTTFLLQNETSADAATFYRAADARVLGKVVPDERLQALLDVFAEKGLFAASSAAIPSDARDVLAVEQGGKRWTWVRRQIGVQQGEALFHEARSYFLEVYNSSMAFRGTDPNARPDFAGERERAQQSGGAAKDKLQRLGGRQQ